MLVAFAVLVAMVAVLVAIVILIVIIVAIALAGLEPRPDTGRRGSAGHHPVAEMRAKSVLRLGVRYRIGGERPHAVVGLRGERPGPRRSRPRERRVPPPP